MFDNYLQVWQEVWPKGWWGKDKHDNFNRYCRYISISINIYIYIYNLWFLRFSYQYDMQGAQVFLSSNIQLRCDANKWLYHICKVREFNLPRHRKLNLMKQQRNRFPVDEFDTWWDLLWLHLTWWDLVWLGLIWFDLVWLLVRLDLTLGETIPVRVSDMFLTEVASLLFLDA